MASTSASSTTMPAGEAPVLLAALEPAPAVHLGGAVPAEWDHCRLGDLLGPREEGDGLDRALARHHVEVLHGRQLAAAGEARVVPGKCPRGDTHALVALGRCSATATPPPPESKKPYTAPSSALAMFWFARCAFGIAPVLKKAYVKKIEAMGKVGNRR